MAPPTLQARRFLQDGFALRLVVTFKGGTQIALGRDVMLYLIGQLAGKPREWCVCGGVCVVGGVGVWWVGGGGVRGRSERCDALYLCRAAGSKEPGG